MSILLDKGTIIAVDEELTPGAGQEGIWSQDDVVLFQEGSGLTPATASIERNNLNGSFIKCQALAGEETTSGSLNVELSIDAVVGSEAGMLLGHKLYKSGLGKYVEQAATVGVNVISEEADPISNPTGYDLYRLSKPSEASTTLAIREYLGGSGDNVLDHVGVIVDSISFDFTAGQIINVGFSASGVGYDALSGETPLLGAGCGGSPFVVKNATFKLDGVTVEASNVSLSISNASADRRYVTSEGIGKKVVTGKEISLSYTLDMDGIAEYTALKNNSTAALFMELVNTDGDEIKFYFPVMDYTEVSKSTADGVITLDVTSMAYNDAQGNAMYIATKKA